MTEWRHSSLTMNEVNARHSAEGKLLSTLGLCVRAGKVIFGTEQICDAMRAGGAKSPTLVLEASDTSENTHKRISDRCAYYKVKHIRLESSGTQLASALGKTSNLAAVAVTDRRMSEMVETHIPKA